MLILSSHYFPCIEWFTALLSAEEYIVDIHEYFVKQTYRNRTNILSANGRLALTIPVKVRNHTPMNEVRIENDVNWQHQHWQAIVSAYGSAPYFFYYQDYFKPLYETRFTHLIDWNSKITEVCLALMKQEQTLRYSKTYCQLSEGDHDLRLAISPKRPSSGDFKSYIQVFAEKYPFEPNLSIMDLLFNHGVRWREFVFV